MKWDQLPCTKDSLQKAFSSGQNLVKQGNVDGMEGRAVGEIAGHPGSFFWGVLQLNQCCMWKSTYVTLRQLIFLPDSNITREL